jgi:hypothetical protein
LTSNLAMSSKWEDPIKESFRLLDIEALNHSLQQERIEIENNNDWDDKVGWKSLEAYKQNMKFLQLKFSGKI